MRCFILLYKDCPIAKRLVYDAHKMLKHSGLYKTRTVIRKEF